MHSSLKYLRIVILCAFYSLSVFAQTSNSLFPVEGNIRERVEFWKKVYTQISTQEAFIHDPEYLNIIYKKVSLPEGRRARKRLIKKEKRKIQNILRSIAKGKTQQLTDEGQKILGMVLDKSSKELYRMSRNIRFQYGLKDRYYKGLISSYKYLDFIQQTYQKMGLPIELSYLPHVESSFNYKAYSKVGAAGIWQFMRSTGRLYGLKVNYIIDERRDPIKATKAAARLLRDNFRRLNSWPLALTAYNHGAQSMVRAIKKLGTTDINTIVQKYKGRLFGFASKNFYATFMATVEISQNPEKYFDSFKKPPRHEFSQIKLTRPYTISQIMKALNIDSSLIKSYNFEIRPIAYRSSLYLPKNFILKLPKTDEKKLALYQTQLEKVKAKVASLETGYMHIISRGETLFDISRIYKVDMNKIVAYNNLDNPSRIFPGMKLKIPGKKTKIEKDIVQDKKEITKVASLKQGNTKDKEVFNFSGDLFAKTFGQVWKKSRHKVKDTPTPLMLPEINLNSYDLDVKKIKDNLYRITVDTEETLGHYADWGLIRIKLIRKANKINYKRPLFRGRYLLLPIMDNNINRFKEQRNEYHLSMQEDFFEEYSITGTKHYKVKKGDNLNTILEKNSLPFWLVRQFQKTGQISDALKVGQIIELPILTAKSKDATTLPTDDTNED